MGRYGIEGSKPGAAAAGVYLSHAVIPTDQSSKGRTRRFAPTLRASVGANLRVRPLGVKLFFLTSIVIDLSFLINNPCSY